MARTDLTPINAPGCYGVNPAALTWTAADVANKNQVTLTGREIVLAHNSGAVAHTITITSVQDPYKRTGDVSAHQVPAGGYRVFGPVALDGWMQADGRLYLEADHAEILFAILRLPESYK